MITPLKASRNAPLWLRVFDDVMAQDPSLKLDDQTLLNFDGANLDYSPEVIVAGVFKINPPDFATFLIITFDIHASHDEITNVKFEIVEALEDSKLLSKAEKNAINKSNQAPDYGDDPDGTVRLLNWKGPFWREGEE